MKLKKTAGQAVVTLLFFVLIAITITSGAVTVILVNSKASSALHEGNNSSYIAESGIENALINLLRNASYPGETINFEDGTAVVTVSGSNPLTITSRGTVNGKSRTVEVTASYTDELLNILTWREI